MESKAFLFRGSTEVLVLISVVFWVVPLRWESTPWSVFAWTMTRGRTAWEIANWSILNN